MNVNSLAKYEFYISNRDREIYEGPADWRVIFPQGMNELTPSSFFLQVDSCYFNNFIPTIMKGINDTFTYDYTDVIGITTRYSLIFQPGVYDVNDIILSLLTELQLRNPAFNLSFDARQQKLVLFVPSGVGISLVRPLANPFETQNYRNGNPNDRMLEMLGWSFVNQAVYTILGGGAGYTWTPDNPVRLDGTAFVHLCIRQQVPAFTSGSKGNKPIGCFPVNAGYGSVVIAENNLQNVFMIDAVAVQQGLEFFLVDEWGVPLDDYVPSNMMVHVRFSLSPAA